MSSKLIFGCGYLGQRVAHRWRDAGHRVFVTTRSADRADEFREQGLIPVLADVTNPQSLSNLPQVATILFCVGFDRHAAYSIHDVYVGGLQAVLLATRDRFEKFVYVSSTGVYGGTDGDWIDESAPCRPTRIGGAACLAAENVLRNDVAFSRSIVLRLAGIYGPGRVPNRKALEEGSFQPGPLDRYLNLIHVEDAAACCVCADKESKLPNLLNVSDGNPVLKRDYYQAICAQLNLSARAARLLADAPNLPAQTSSRNSDDSTRNDHKRVSNRKMLAELSIQLQFEDYRVGLCHALRDEV